jgi:hypothetical protein
MRTALINAVFGADQSPGGASTLLDWGSGSAPSSSLFGCGLALQQNGAEAMQIAPEHRQRDIALEAVDAVIRAAIQAVRLQRIDGGLDRGVAAAQADEFGIAFACRFGLIALALSRQQG